MASAEEQQIEIPTDGEGEPVMPKKERKPHIKGITFREFDVSILRTFIEKLSFRNSMFCLFCLNKSA